MFVPVDLLIVFCRSAGDQIGTANGRPEYQAAGGSHRYFSGVLISRE